MKFPKVTVQLTTTVFVLISSIIHCHLSQPFPTTTTNPTTATTTPTKTTPTTTTTKTASCRFEKKSIDVAFIVDQSGSIKLQPFERAKDFVVKVVESFDVDSKNHRIAVIFYERSVTVPLSFSDSTRLGKKESQSIIRDFPYANGALTKTGAALSEAVNQFRAGGRLTDKAASSIAIVLTDGKSTDDVIRPSDNARNSGVTLYAIGVGNGVDYGELSDIAGDPSRVFNVSDMFKLTEEFSGRMEEKICEDIEIELGCRPIADFPYGTVSCTDGFFLDSTCSFACDPGFRLESPGSTTANIAESVRCVAAGVASAASAPSAAAAATIATRASAWDGAIPRCVDVDECAESRTDPCLLGASFAYRVCKNLPGKFACECKQGFEPAPQTPHECSIGNGKVVGMEDLRLRLWQQIGRNITAVPPND